MPAAAPRGVIVWPNAADRLERRPVYPTDLTDDQWSVITPLIPGPAWIPRRGGRPEGYSHREMIDAMLYVDDNSIKSRALPTDCPDQMAAYRVFRRWRDQGLLAVLHDPAVPGLPRRGRARAQPVRSGDRLTVATCC